MPYNKAALLSLTLCERKEIVNVLIASILVEETKHKCDWKQELVNETIKYNNAHPGNDAEKN